MNMTNFVKLTVALLYAGCSCVFKYESEKTPTVFSRGWYDTCLELQSIVADHWCWRVREIPAAMISL